MATFLQRPLYTTAALLLGPLLYYRHHSTTVTSSLQRLALYNSYLLSIAVTPLKRPPLYYNHIFTVATSLQRPPLYKGHLLYYGNLSTMATSLQRRLYTTASPLQGQFFSYGHLLSTTANPLLRRPLL